MRTQTLFQLRLQYDIKQNASVIGHKGNQWACPLNLSFTVTISLRTIQPRLDSITSRLLQSMDPSWSGAVQDHWNRLWICTFSHFRAPVRFCELDGFNLSPYRSGIWAIPKVRLVPGYKRVAEFWFLVNLSKFPTSPSSRASKSEWFCGYCKCVKCVKHQIASWKDREMRNDDLSCSVKMSDDHTDCHLGPLCSSKWLLR